MKSLIYRNGLLLSEGVVPSDKVADYYREAAFGILVFHYRLDVCDRILEVFPDFTVKKIPIEKTHYRCLEHTCTETLAYAHQRPCCYTHTLARLEVDLAVRFSRGEEINKILLDYKGRVASLETEREHWEDYGPEYEALDGILTTLGIEILREETMLKHINNEITAIQEEIAVVKQEMERNKH